MMRKAKLRGTTMQADPAPIQIRDLVIAYGARRVVDRLSLEVAAGEVYALLGGNGAGKSTTLQALLGFISPQSGEIRICGSDPAAKPDEARRQIAYIAENVALYEHLSALENIAYFLDLAAAKRPAAAMAEAFRTVGLPQDAWSRPVSKFSKGMRQKTAIALALLRNSRVLLLDEPTSGLDPGAAADFHALVGRLRAHGAAVLMVTQDLLGASDVADRIGFLDHGRIVHEVSAGPDRAFDLQALHSRFQRAPAPGAAA